MVKCHLRHLHLLFQRLRSSRDINLVLDNIPINLDPFNSTLGFPDYQFGLSDNIDARLLYGLLRGDMDPGQEILCAVQKVLEPFVRPREEVSQIRRVLGFHLESCIEGGIVSSPLSLVEPTGVNLSSSSRGLRREYLRALIANITAQTEHDAILREDTIPVKAASASGQNANTSFLDEHLSAIRLRRKHEKLQLIEKYLDLLNQKPAAASRYLDPNEIFRDSPPLPDVPKEVMEGLVVNGTAAGSDLNELIDQLERHVLRAKLLLEQEEDCLGSIKSRFSTRSEEISASLRLDALNATRNELISWIETELGKASAEGTDGQEDKDTLRQQHTNGKSIGDQVVGIKDKYATYLAARKSLLHIISQCPQPVIKPPTDQRVQEVLPVASKKPTAYILSPYLENLLAHSREQKGSIVEKSHLNVAIAKQLKENRQFLNHLTDESQMLPGHPMSGATRRNPGGLSDGLSASDNLNALTRVKPWVFAADSAKIATLEAVTEKIEEGQLAMEGSMKTIGEIDQLLGRHQAQRNHATEGCNSEEDVWLVEGQPSGKPTGGARKHTEQQVEDVWDSLNGSLGLLRPEDQSP